MKAVWTLPLLALGMTTVLVAAACGGGGNDGAGKGQRVTDPEKVPSSTPIQGAIVFQIRGDKVSTIGGPTGTVAAGQTPAAAKTYTVRPGDTCGAIAAANNTTIDELIRTNRAINSDCTNLKAGDQLRIPAAPTPTGANPLGTPSRPGTGREYKVAAGDTCDAIARNQGVTLDRLQAANPGMNCANLQIGFTVRIPQ